MALPEVQNCQSNIFAFEKMDIAIKVLPWLLNCMVVYCMVINFPFSPFMFDIEMLFSIASLSKEKSRLLTKVTLIGKCNSPVPQNALWMAKVACAPFVSNVAFWGTVAFRFLFRVTFVSSLDFTNKKILGQN